MRQPLRSLQAPRAGFSLVELLVVVAIIAISLGLIVFLPDSDKRHAAVKSAAEELAATLRLARSLAIERRAVVGVSFNIQNGPATSGRVINNWGGGHWYRIIGPCQNEPYVKIINESPVGAPMYPQYFENGKYKAGRFFRDVTNSWIGDRHVLTARKVRFLALGDQDNGGLVTGDRRYGATYPRPWFGYWDAATRRLHPWGGYDPAATDGTGQPASGFWFQGIGGAAQADCRNPADLATQDGVSFLKQGEARPLVNGEWLDYVLRFNPDGTVGEGEVMQARKTARKRSAYGGEVGGLSLFMDATGHPSHSWNGPITSYASHTGCWAVTLAPDMARDGDGFASAREAWTSLMPAYRVTVNRYGVVKVVKVRSTEPANVLYDTTTVDYQSPASVMSLYQRNVATRADGSPRGIPVSDFLTPELLARPNRGWWMMGTP